jgi:cytochrome c556
MKRTAILACGLTLAALAATVVAQEMRPDRAIKYRQGLMYAMNVNFGVLSRMAKGEIPYAKDAAITRAKNISELAAMPWEGFVPVSHTGGRTKAKPEIWQDKAKFDKLAEAMQAELPKLLAATQSGDPGQLKSAVGRVGDACGKCHDAFVDE